MKSLKDMKKYLLNLGALGLASLLLVSGCASTAAPQTAAARATAAAQAPAYQSFSGVAAAVDKYGNVTTSIKAADLAAAGYEQGDLLLVAAEGKSETAPYVTSYSDVDQGSLLVMPADSGAVQMAINFGNCSERLGIKAGDSVTLSMSVKGGYAGGIAAHQLKKSENRADYASDAVFANFREVRAGKIKPGRLYRSANPILGDARGPYAARLAEAAGVKTVINLADSDEELAKLAGNSAWYAGLIKSGNVVNLNMGVDFTSPDFAVKLGKGLRFLASHPGPYLVHCNEGKDRAGVAVAMIEALCGATVSEVVSDYMMSYENYYGVKPGDARYTTISKIITDILKSMNGGTAVNDGNLRQTALAYLTEKAGLSAAEIAQVEACLEN